jgi:PAS domain S-box-containing protein
MERFTISGVTELLREISASRYEPRSLESISDDEEREFFSALNQIHSDRRELIERNYARNRLIIDSTPVAICITDESGNYEYANPRYRELTEYREDELIGRHFTLVVPTETQQELSGLHDEFMGRRYELTGQWEIISKSGRRIPILANAAYVIDVDERPKKITFVVDVSDLRREIDERRRLEHVRDNVERILRHDLRNPIDGIKTAAEFLLEDDLGERPNEFIRLMYDAAVRARSRIDNSLAYTRMEQGSYQIERKRINIVQLVRDVVREVGDVLTAYRVTIVSRYRGAPLRDQFDIELWGEEEFLHDALTNLVRNAVEASHHDETIVVEVDESEGDAGAANGSVSDKDAEGPGEKGGSKPGETTPSDNHMILITVRNAADIPEEIRDTLFDPYVTFGKKTGTGLGTYTAHLITKAHGGSIDVQTGEGNGTAITLRLPRGRFGA